MTTFHRNHHSAQQRKPASPVYTLLHPRLLALASILFALPQFAHAFLGETAVTRAFIGGIRYIIDAIGSLFWTIAEAAARFLSWILVEFNQSVGFVDNTMVQNGWSVIRDIANWVFIVFLLISAIATVLDLEGLKKYSARTLVPKLLLIALLVNFSLFFTGFLVNVSQVVMTLFVEQGTKDSNGVPVDIGVVLANSMQWSQAQTANRGAPATEAEIDPWCINKGYLPGSFDCYVAINEVNDIDDGSIAGAARKMILSGASLIFAVGSAFIFLFLGILLIIRVVVLWMTLILSPLAFVAMIGGRFTEFSKWWTNLFFNWTFFGVFAAFFIWLATWLAVYLNESGSAFNTIPITNSADAGLLLQSAGALLKYLTIFIFLFMSMVVSKKLAGHGATYASTAMSGIVGASMLGLAGARAGGRGAAMTRAGTSLQSALGRPLASTRIPVLRGAGRRLMRPEQQRMAKLEGEAKQIERLNDRDAEAFYRGAGGQSKQKMEALFAQQGRLDRIVGGQSYRDLLRAKTDVDAKGDPTERAKNATDMLASENFQKGFAEKMQKAQDRERQHAPHDTTVRMASMEFMDNAAEQAQLIKRMNSQQAADTGRRGSFWESTRESAKRAREVALKDGGWGGEQFLSAARNASAGIRDTMLKAADDMGDKLGPRIATALESSSARALGIARESKPAQGGPDWRSPKTYR